MFIYEYSSNSEYLLSSRPVSFRTSDLTRRTRDLLKTPYALTLNTRILKQPEKPHKTFEWFERLKYECTSYKSADRTERPLTSNCKEHENCKTIIEELVDD